MSKIIGWVALFFSTTCFSGFWPSVVKPGKWGGTIGSAIAYCALLYLSRMVWFDFWWLLLVVCLIAGPGTIAVHYGEKQMRNIWGKRPRHTGELVSGDFNETNADEVLGIFVGALVIWSARDEVKNYWFFLTVLFALFRWIDIKKPGPVKWAEERFTGRWSAISVMADDFVGGIMAGSCTLLIVLITELIF